MNGRLEHNMKQEEAIKRLLENVPIFVEEWDLNMKASGKSVATRRNYITKLINFISSITSNTKEIKLADMTKVAVQKYFVQIQTKNKNGEAVETSDSYKCITWAMLNSFFSYMIKCGYIDENPVLIIDKPKNHDLVKINQERKLLTDKDFKKIIQALENDYNCSEDYKDRNKAILLLFMTTGMRKTALTEINIKDIDFDNNNIVIIDKRKIRHQYVLNELTINTIKSWLDKRDYLKYKYNYPNENTDALFINKNGERIGTDAIEDLVARYSEKGLGYKISPHKLRAGCASILYNKTHDLEFVRRAIGHADVSTTTRYIVTQGKEREEMSNIMGKLLD